MLELVLFFSQMQIFERTMAVSGINFQFLSQIGVQVMANLLGLRTLILLYIYRCASLLTVALKRQVFKWGKCFARLSLCLF
jgi:hypothetical protein